VVRIKNKKEKMKKIVLGFTGEMACGKGTATKYITEKYNGSSHRFSTMLRDLLNRLYLEQSRKNMQEISTAIRRTFGEDTMARVIYEDVKNDLSEIIAIDGVRRLADIKYLKQLPEFKLVYIDTSIENRYERIVKRGENPDDNEKTLEQFRKDQEGEADMQIRGLKDKADFFLDNNGTTEELYAQIDAIIKEC
jgi:dephospho-CoA kinase